jgi:hypothetical protein
LINLGSNYFDFAICINASSKYVYYTNPTYSWIVSGPSGSVSSGNSGSGLIASGTCGSQNNIQTVRVDNLIPNTSYTVSMNLSNGGSTFGSTMSVRTNSQVTTQVTVDSTSSSLSIETRTAVSNKADSGTSTSSSIQATKSTGLGGYAVVHPDGHVCGVIVATSSDPYGNGGTMPIPYMGCPVGARIVFQTNPSPSGNVAGWHGENVIYNGSEFVIKNNNSSSSTVQTTISGGVATDSNGRVWDTGSGATLKPGTTSASDTTNVRTDTATVRTDTSTSTSNSSSSTTDTRTSTVSTSPQPLAITVAIPDSSTVTQVVKNLTPALLESQLVAKVVAKTQSIVQVNTDFANSLLQVVAVKKGSKTLNLSIQTDQNGDAKINLKSNLSGYSISLKAGNINLDTDKIK